MQTNTRQQGKNANPCGKRWLTWGVGKPGMKLYAKKIYKKSSSGSFMEGPSRCCHRRRGAGINAVRQSSWASLCGRVPYIGVIVLRETGSQIRSRKGGVRWCQISVEKCEPSQTANGGLNCTKINVRNQFSSCPPPPNTCGAGGSRATNCLISRLVTNVLKRTTRCT